jgi:hypothetical protein
MKFCQYSAISAGFGEKSFKFLTSILVLPRSLRFSPIAPNGGGMKSCRLRAISYQVTQKLERATTLE